MIRRLQPASILLAGLPLVFAAMLFTVPDTDFRMQVAGFSLIPVKLDALARWFTMTFCIALSAGTLFAATRAQIAELASALLYGVSAIGVILAGDLLTALLFWELMAVFSALLIWSAATPEAYQASMRYIAIHLVGGVLLMVGIAGLASQPDGLAIRSLTADSSEARYLILIAVLINAAAWPLSAWAPDAYPSASVYGTVFLSAFTTKTAVYLLLRLFTGESLLMLVGAAMIVYGVIYALRESDLRRLLIYSLVVQVGYMVMTIGSSGDGVVSAVSLHAFAHVIYKMLLLMAAAVVIRHVGSGNLVDLIGSARHHVIIMAAVVIGSLTLAGLPLTTAFLSKSLIGNAIGSDPAWAYPLMTAAAVMAMLYVGVRLPWVLLVNRPALEPDKKSLTSAAEQIAMLALILLSLIPALMPWVLTDWLPGIDPAASQYSAWYSIGSVAKQLFLLALGAVAFIVLKRRTAFGFGGTPDTDWLYRVAGPAVGRRGVALIRQFHADVTKIVVREQIPRFLRFLESLHDPNGVFGKSWSTSVMALWVAGLLAFYVLSYFV